LYKGGDKEFKINKVFFEKKVQKYFKEIESVKGLNINFDNFTFVLVKRKISKVEKELVDNFESSNPHIRICDYEKFLFNITAHKLVSKHSLYKKSYRTLLKKLMLDTPDKLPYILHADPISKHFNFRDGEIIEITRDTMGKKITMYRICKNFNYSHLAYTTNNNKYVKGTEEDGTIGDVEHETEEEDGTIGDVEHETEEEVVDEEEDVVEGEEAGWESVTDPVTGEVYYKNTTTGETARWEEGEEESGEEESVEGKKVDEGKGGRR
jgi:DNA-directed RNA polymerase subunit H (RpoH/RPB5)